MMVQKKISGVTIFLMLCLQYYSDSDMQWLASCFDLALLQNSHNFSSVDLTCFPSWTIFWPVTKMELMALKTAATLELYTIFLYSASVVPL